MNEKLIERLMSLGYEYTEADAGLLTFCTGAVEEKIKNRINRSEIPSELEYMEIDMICGEFLNTKKSVGQLTSYDFEQIAQSIKEGDTQVTFADGTSPEKQFEILIGNMMNGNEADLIRFRKMVW